MVLLFLNAETVLQAEAHLPRLEEGRSEINFREVLRELRGNVGISQGMVAQFLG